MTFSHWQRPHSFSLPGFSTDVLILGGGFVGLSTAWWLSEMDPSLKITVLDRRQVGEGASGRNAGFLTKGSAQFYRELNRLYGKEIALSILNFSDTSIQLLHQNILRSSPEIKTEKSQSITLLKKNQTSDAWKGDFSPEEFSFEWIDSPQLFPTLGTGFSGGYVNSIQEYKINPMQIIQSLKMSLEARKIQIVENISGFELTPEGCRTEVHTIKAKKIVLALNGYLPQFHPSLKPFVTARRAQMLAVEFEGELDSPYLHYDPADLVYWRKSADNVLLIGGKRMLDVDNEVGDFDRLSAVIQNSLEDYIRDTIGLKYKILHRWAGTMGFTGTDLPIIQEVQAPLTTYIVGGFSGHGMGMGFHAAKQTASLITGEITESFFSGIKKESIQL